MISANRDALLCDFAETYGIYDLRALPVSTLATLAVGLRDNSRIKLYLSGGKIPRGETLLAAVVDRLSMLVWFQSEDGHNGTNRPASVLEALIGTEKQTGDVIAFDTSEGFEAAWARITEVENV